MPRAPLALPAMTGQKYSVQAWRDQTSPAASGPKSCPPLAAPHRAVQRDSLPELGRWVVGAQWGRRQRRSSHRAMPERSTSGPWWPARPSEPRAYPPLTGRVPLNL